MFISSGDGIFEIHAKFYGVAMEQVDVDIQVFIRSRGLWKKLLSAPNNIIPDLIDEVNREAWF